jgi:hypothetical protein
MERALSDRVNQAADRVILLEAELEIAAVAHTKEAELAAIREKLHHWVDSVIGVVAAPGVGRVTLIHTDGRESRIASPQLPYLLSRPARFGGEGDA